MSWDHSHLLFIPIRAVCLYYNKMIFRFPDPDSTQYPVLPIAIFIWSLTIFSLFHHEELAFMSIVNFSWLIQTLYLISVFDLELNSCMPVKILLE